MNPSTNKRNYNIIAFILYAIISVGAFFDKINLTSHIIISLIYVYFTYEYNRNKTQPPEELTITYQDGEPKESIKKLDGKTVTVKLKVTKFEPKIILD